MLNFLTLLNVGFTQLWHFQLELFTRASALMGLHFPVGSLEATNWVFRAQKERFLSLLAQNTPTARSHGNPYIFYDGANSYEFAKSYLFYELHNLYEFNEWPHHWGLPHTSPGNPFNSTNPTTTLTLQKCFHFCVPYASDVQPMFRENTGVDTFTHLADAFIQSDIQYS